jgi:DNA-binding CsgD family transcriptional regulator
MSSTRGNSPARRDPRLVFFEVGLSLGVLSGVAAALLIDLVGHHVALRLTVLIAITTLVAAVLVDSTRSYSILEKRQFLVPASTLLIAGLLAVANGRFNATLIVVFAWLIAVTIPARPGTASAATAIVVVCYLLGIVLRGDSLELDGSFGDLIALAAGVASVVATRLFVKLLARLDAEAQSRMPASEAIVEGSPNAVALPERPDVIVTDLPSKSCKKQPADLEVLASAGLGGRRAEVALLITQGKRQSEIADELGIKVSTVKEHETAARAFFGVQNRVALAGRVTRLLLDARAAQGDGEAVAQD